MSKTIAYLRASTGQQDVSHQKLELLECARSKHLHIDRFIEVTVSTRKATKQRRIDELMALLDEGNTLMVTELSRLGRSTAEVIGLVNALIKRHVRVLVVKQQLDINEQDMVSKVMVTLFSLFSELERDLISLRTKEALAARKAKGIKLGKPKGTLQKSKFDNDVERIKELLGYGLSVRKIARVLRYPSHIGLYAYVKTRGLRTSVPA